LIVCTPKTLADTIKNLDNRAIDHPFRRLNFMVLDEADMLLDGSYLSEVERVMESLKLVRRAQIHEGSLKPHERTVQYVLSAATMPTVGTKSIDILARRTFPHVCTCSCMLAEA
jgi:superfamily II DNA/RNA helicase